MDPISGSGGTNTLMSKLNDFTTEELKAEVFRRSLQETPPKAVNSPCFNRLRNYMLESVATSLGKNVGSVIKPETFKHCIFELAMEAMYGTNVWLWWNANCSKAAIPDQIIRTEYTKSGYAAQFKSGKLAGTDNDSGGYPWETNNIKDVHVFSSKKEADEFAQHFKEPTSAMHVQIVPITITVYTGQP